MFINRDDLLRQIIDVPHSARLRAHFACVVYVAQLPGKPSLWSTPFLHS